jgi:hypothetical protein
MAMMMAMVMVMLPLLTSGGETLCCRREETLCCRREETLCCRREETLCCCREEALVEVWRMTSSGVQHALQLSGGNARQCRVRRIVAIQSPSMLRPASLRRPHPQLLL